MSVLISSLRFSLSGPPMSFPETCTTATSPSILVFTFKVHLHGLIAIGRLQEALPDPGKKGIRLDTGGPFGTRVL